MTLSPEQAWQSALGQLQMEMPKASFDTWVRDTRLVSYEDGLFFVGVRNDYTREWLESRLTSTVTRLLMGIMNRGVSVAFVVNTPAMMQEDEHGDGDDDEKNNELETADVQVVHRLSYDEVVNPERIVALPGYFSRLVPEIGARNAWLYVGWRQAVWDGQRQDSGSKHRRVPVWKIIRFSGLSRRTFFRAVEEEATWKALNGLVERTDEEPRWARGKDRQAHRLPNHYTVHLTLPLSHADAFHIQDWLEVRLREGVSLLDALRMANGIQELVGELLPPLGVTAPDPSASLRTVMEIVGLLAGEKGELPPDLREASENLHRKIVSAFGTILLTHYFLDTVIPNAKLTAHQAWLVALLRDRCYYNRDTGEVREEVLVRGGYTELAEWLGLNRPKTIWEWIRDVDGPVSAFLCILPSQDQDDVDSMRLRVRMEEPIFDGAGGTIRMAHLAPVGGVDDTNRNGANGTNTMAEMAPLDGADGTFAWREWHGLKHLNSSPNTPNRITSTTEDGPAVAVPPSWVLQKILIQSRVHPKVMKELLENNASVLAFVSWLLYACSPAGDGIQNPLSYALASLRDNPDRGPGGAYDRLAALPPAEFVRLVRWSINRVSRKYELQPTSSGNELWEKTVGASERHAILLAILLGEQETTETWEQKETQTFMNGGKVTQDADPTRTYHS